VSVYTTASQAVLVGGWHHLAVTYDGRGGANAAAGLTMYIDGIAVPVTRINNAAYVAMENAGAPLQIARESPSWQQFNGALDEIRLWNLARTAAEIQAAMAIELGGSEAGLVGRERQLRRREDWHPVQRHCLGGGRATSLGWTTFGTGSRS
jgi:hypothetical protein